MLRMISLILCLLTVACQAPQDTVFDDLDNQKDLSPAEVEDDIFLSALEGIHDVEVSLPPSPITWKTCSGEVLDHPCNLEGPDQRGDVFGLYALYGHPIVLDFSTAWCGPCMNAAAHVQEVQDLYRDSGLIYITILIETADGSAPTQADVAAWAADYGITDSPVVASSRKVLRSGAGTWVLSGWPTFYYIDSEMVLRDIDRGYSEQEVIHSIDWLLTL
jgi:thiol-disulfide isomerase/thioredoxin